MKSKLFARILAIVLCVTIVGSVLLIAIPMMTGSAAVTPVKDGTGHINTDGVNLRSGPGTNYNIITSMDENTQVVFLDSTRYSGGWYQIKELSEGFTGYVKEEYVTADTAPAPAAGISIKNASTYVGCQYAVWQTGFDKPTWKSSDTKVCTIDQYGVITARAAGTATITASENGKTAGGTITVKQGTAVNLSANALLMAYGKSAQLTSSTSGVKWFSSNKNAVTVNNGVVTAVGEGYATISAYTATGAATCLIKVEEPQSQKIKISATHSDTFVGCQYALWVSGAQSPVWSSSNTAVATVDQNGVFTAKSVGKARIYAAEGSERAYCDVTVKAASPAGISASDMTLTKGATGLLFSDTAGVKWFSTNKNVATVSGGTVTAKDNGYSVIVAYTSDKASTCLLHVTDNAASGASLNIKTATTYVGCQYAVAQTGITNPTWTSSNPTVCTVDENGIVTAVAAGAATITAAGEGGFASGTVVVKNGTVTNISASSVTVQEGKSVQLTSSTGGVKWFSSNKNVATVSGGTVTGKAVGYATISAYTSTGAATCLVKVDEKQSDIVKISVASGSTYVGCQYAFWQTGAYNPTWRSSDTSVADIDQNGVMTAKAPGKVRIYVSEGSETSYSDYTVKPASPAGISKASLSLVTGQTAQLSSGTEGVKWFSSNKNVATVSGGIVAAKSVGYATITAYTGDKASTCLVFVDEAQSEKIKLSVNHSNTYVGCQYALWQTGAENPTWSSSDANIASVDQYGVVTANAVGTARIYAIESGERAYCDVHVKESSPAGISPDSLSLTKGAKATLSSSTSGVSWFSTNKNVATVSKGVVTAVAPGYTVIVAYTADKASTCLVQVGGESAVSKPTGKVTGDYVNLRAGAGTSYAVITTLTRGNVFTFLSDTLYNGSWYHVETEEGSRGYIIQDYVEKIEPPVITLTAKTATTYVGCQYALGFSGVDNPEWSSSNTAVATVDQNGVVTAKSAGTATIRASQDGGVGSCVFTVKSGNSVNISQSSLTVAEGKTAKLTSSTSGVKWFSSNKSVATVSGGTVTAKSIGYTTISAYTDTGASTCLVKVVMGDGTIKLSASSATIYVGNQYAIGMTGSTSATWSSSNTGVASVDKNGVVTAKSTGTATIKASNSASSASCVITVKSGYAPGVSAASITIPAGKSVILESDSYVSWSSSNPAVATVGSNGVVDTKAAGYAAISAYTSSGASTCLLQVTSPAPVRFVYASPNSAPKNSAVTLKAITDTSRTAVRFVVTNGSRSYTVNATSKVKDGSTYIWSGSQILSTSGKWTIKAYSKTASTDYATVSGDGEGEVFVTNSTNSTATVIGERRASDEIIKLIALFEGFLPSVTADYITDDPTLGHGKVVTTNEQFYNNLTKNEAYAYLCQTVNYGPYTVVTNDFLEEHNIKFNQQQFDALVCFAYNVGAYAIYNDSNLENVLLDCYASGGAVKAGAAGTINSSGVNLRSGAGTSYTALTTMSANTAFTFVDGTLYNSHWYKIKLSNGTVGYVYADYASVSGSGRDFNYVNKNEMITQFLQYHHAAGNCYWGLLTRRVDEMEIFFYGEYECDGDYNNHNMYFRCSKNSSFGIG